MTIWNVALRLVGALVVILVYIKLSSNSQLAPMPHRTRWAIS